MKNALSWTLILMLGGVKCQPSIPESIPASINNNYPLYLTPYIMKNETKEARAASKVYMPIKENVTAYSGFITVNSTNSTCNINLFFLFIVSKNDSPDDPLMLWTQGGPGLSALFGELLENGPIAFDLETNISIRNYTLQNIANVIYLDLPVGAGYSFTNDTKCYSKSLDEITDHVMDFLKQFLVLFPEYICRKFYLAGESYAARYSVAIANRMLNSNDGKQLLLKGVIGGNGFLGSILDLADSSDFMYQLSMVNEKGQADFFEQFEKMRTMYRNGTPTPAILQELINTLFTSNPFTLYQNVTLYNDYLTPLQTERSRYVLASFVLLNSSFIRNALHIGPSVPFEHNNTGLLASLAPDYLTNISTMLSKVLNETNVLLYTGQIDPLFPSVKQRAYLSSLHWKESEAYKNAPRVPWKPTKEYYGFAGFLTRASNFTYALMIGMSHYGAVEKVYEVYHLMQQFMTNHSGAVNS